MLRFFVVVGFLVMLGFGMSLSRYQKYDVNNDKFDFGAYQKSFHSALPES